jgi:hypothetical protein
LGRKLSSTWGIILGFLLVALLGFAQVFMTFFVGSKIDPKKYAQFDAKHPGLQGMIDAEFARLEFDVGGGVRSGRTESIEFRRVRVSHDGAFVGAGYCAGEEECGLALLNLPTGVATLLRAPSGLKFYDFAISPDGRRVAAFLTCETDCRPHFSPGFLAIFDVSERRPVCAIRRDEIVSFLRFEPNGNVVTFARRDAEGGIRDDFIRFHVASCLIESDAMWDEALRQRRTGLQFPIPLRRCGDGSILFKGTPPIDEARVPGAVEAVERIGGSRIFSLPALLKEDGSVALYPEALGLAGRLGPLGANWLYPAENCRILVVKSDFTPFFVIGDGAVREFPVGVQNPMQMALTGDGTAIFLMWAESYSNPGVYRNIDILRISTRDGQVRQSGFRAAVIRARATTSTGR